jgi:hypothetical protein
MTSKSPSQPSEKHDDISKELRESVSEIVDYGGDSRLPPPPQLTPEQEKKLWRKIDLRLMPILSLMYLFSYLDRGNCDSTGQFMCLTVSFV